MIIIKTEEEIKKMRKGGRILNKIMKKLIRKVKPGISTMELNNYAEELIKKYKAKPSFKNYKGYPYTLCTAINNKVVHGLPNEKEILKEGDIIGLDLGIEYKGYYTDKAMTIGVGKISKEARRLIEVTKKSLEIALRKIKPEIDLREVGKTIQEFVERNGYSVVRDLTGHGVGKKQHEPPQVLNFFSQEQKKIILKEGYTLAIEPMVNQGSYDIETLKDGWTIVTKDGSLSSHFEETIAITKKSYKILTR